MYKTASKREKLSIKTGIENATNLLKGSVIFVMKNMSKQVIILDNISSPYIHQAIIILKNHPPHCNDKIIAEAEKIVANYFNSDTVSKESYNIGRKGDKKLKMSVIFLSIALAASTLINILR